MKGGTRFGSFSPPVLQSPGSLVSLAVATLAHLLPWSPSGWQSREHLPFPFLMGAQGRVSVRGLGPHHIPLTSGGTGD